MIASAAQIGISRRELLEEYFFDELLIVFDEYSEMNRIPDKDEQEEDSTQEVYADEW